MKTLPAFASITRRIRNLFAFSLFAILTLATLTLATGQAQAQNTAQNLTGTFNQQTGEVTLTWLPANIDQLSHYMVLRGGAVLANNLGPDVLTYTDSTAQPGTNYGYEVYALISDGEGELWGRTNVQTLNPTPPVANAGPDQTGIAPGSQVTLNGEGSFDADARDVLTYAWEQTSGTPITLRGANTAAPTFTAPTQPAFIVLTFRLTVTDLAGQTSTDEVTVQNTVENLVFTAQPGEVTLIWRRPTDIIGNFDGYVVFRDVFTGIVTLADDLGPNVLTFTDRTVQPGRRYDYQVTARTSPRRISVGYVIVQTPNPTPPVANAGPDQTETTLGSRMTLDGSDSSDADINDVLSYTWEQTSGTPVTLSGANTAAPTFTVPTQREAIGLTFRLTVTDLVGQTGTDEVIVTLNRPPTANAGNAQTVAENATVTLSGSGSDPENETLTYAWTTNAGITLSDAAIADPAFTAPSQLAVIDFTFRLTVTDAGRAG